MKAWKYLRRDQKGRLRTLYKAWKRSKTLPLGMWLDAEKKMGSERGPQYLTGWHCFLDKDQAEKYKGRFKTPVELIEIEAQGLTMKFSGNCYLADWIKLPGCSL